MNGYAMTSLRALTLQAQIDFKLDFYLFFFNCSQKAKGFQQMNPQEG
jgi:hypothetical protein